MVTLAAKTRFVSGSVRGGVIKQTRKFGTMSEMGRGGNFFSLKNVSISFLEF